MWRDTFEEFSFDVDDYIDAGDNVIMPGWVTVHTRGSSAAVREPYNWVAKLRGGTILEVHEYRTKAEALKAVGLEE